jgi:hypothetical protein
MVPLFKKFDDEGQQADRDANAAVHRICGNWSNKVAAGGAIFGGRVWTASSWLGAAVSATYEPIGCT